MRCYSDYMHEEYGALDSDYVFVNLWGGQIGRAMTYANVDELVRRTRRRVGFHFTAHTLRHTYATLARCGGVPIEVLSKLLTHRSVETTNAIYVHASRRTYAPSSSARACGRSLGAAVTPSTAMVAEPPPVGRSWTHVLLGAVRPEFHAEVYVPDPADGCCTPTCASRCLDRGRIARWG